MNQPHEWSPLSRFDLNLFRVFEVVYRERNLTRAAGLLHLSQSAVSHALARLRDQLGDPLFVRQGRGVAPTPLAERLAPGIHDALAGLHRSMNRCQTFDPRRDARTFQLNMPEQLEPLVLPAILAHLRQAAPRIEIRCNSLHWADLKAELGAGRIDLAIEIARPTDAALRRQHLLDDSLCVMAGPGFAGDLSAEEYLAADHVAVTSRRRGICIEDLALGHLGLTRQVRQRCQHYLSAALLVAQGGYLLTLTRGYAELINRGLGNRLLPMPLALPAVTLNLYWSRQADDEAGSLWLRGELAELAGLRPGWRFVAADLSADMLALARQRCARLGLLERIELHCGDVAGLPPAPPCDAALVLLVLHFLRGDQAKRRFLEAVAERLAPAAPLLLANLMEARDAFERPVQAEACRLAGLSPEDSDGMLQRLREDFDPLSEQRLGELLEDTGFVLPSRYFQAVGYQAWIAFRAG